MNLLFKDIIIGEITYISRDMFDLYGQFIPNINFNDIKEFMYSLTDEDFILNENTVDIELWAEENWLIIEDDSFIPISVPAIYPDGDIYWRCR